MEAEYEPGGQDSKEAQSRPLGMRPFDRSMNSSHNLVEILCFVNLLLLCGNHLNSTETSRKVFSLRSCCLSLTENVMTTYCVDCKPGVTNSNTNLPQGFVLFILRK